jgi:cell wall-associated NlpC family hydrolase
MMKLGWILMLIGSLSVMNATAATQKSGSGSPDSAYTGASESTSDTPKPTKTKHKTKAKSPVFWANDPEKPGAASVSAMTNSVVQPSTSASTNVVIEPGNSPSTNFVSKTEPPPATNFVAEPSAPVSTNTVSAPTAPPLPSTNNVVAPAEPPKPPDRVATLSTTDLKEFTNQPPRIQALIEHALDLTTQNLKYQYGSCDPKNGGMDCSGTVYYLLREAGLKDVPRDASEMYAWVWKERQVNPVTSGNLSTFELGRLKPGDLLFWTGTYAVERDPPITHVMIYLGTNRQTGKPVMMGASEGRTYENKSRYGVSVFDFVLPKSTGKSGESSARFIGYGPVPGL